MKEFLVNMNQESIGFILLETVILMSVLRSWRSWLVLGKTDKSERQLAISGAAVCVVTTIIWFI